MTHAPRASRLFRLLVLSLVLPLSSCCEDDILTYEQAVQRIEQDRQQLRRVTVQRSVVEKKLALDRSTSRGVPDPREFLRQAQAEHDQRAKELDQQIVQEREHLRLDEALIASMRAGS